MTRIPTTRSPHKLSAGVNDFESHIEAFEEAPQAQGPEAVAAFLPEADHPLYTAISAELIRVDLERRYASNDRGKLEEYRKITPALFEATAELAEVAFEEYRLRCRAGEHPDPKKYESFYGIDSATWPKFDPAASLENKRPSPDSSQSFPLVGDTFGSFELLEELGRGAFGIVYLARQRELASRDVVLKITPCRSLEAQRLAKLQHTNITPIYSTHTDGEWLAICMPYLGRTTLADRLKSDRLQRDISTIVDHADETLRVAPATIDPLPIETEGKKTVIQRPQASEREVADIVAQLAEGLAHAHGRGIVHSDLKPANVLLGEDGVARLLDFNLAADSSAEEPQTLLVGGTLPYLAPEHLESLDTGAPVLPASDIYSLGVLLFELLTNKLPFSRPTNSSPSQIAELVAGRRNFKPSDLDAFPRLSPALKAIVAKALAPNETDRYTQAEDMAEDLRRHLSNQPLLHAKEPIGTERLSKWSRYHAKALRWNVAGLLLVAIGLLTWSLIGRSERLAQTEAQIALETFRQDATTALLYLHTPGPEPELWAIGAEAAQEALDQFDPLQGNEQGLSLLKMEERDWVLAESNRLHRFLDIHNRRTTSGANVTSSPLGLEPETMSDDPIDLAIAKANSRDYEGVITILDSPAIRSSNDPAGWLLLGNAQAAQSQLIDAEASYTALIALQPEAMVGPYYRGMARLQAGRYTLAEQDFTDALKNSPGKSCLLLNRALARRRLSKWKEAEEDVTSALALDATNPRSWYLRAEIRRELGDKKGAATDIKEVLAREPLDDLGWSARGLALLEQSKERALAELRKGLAIYPQSPSLLKNVIHVLADQLNRSEEAAPYADRLVAARPTDQSARLTRAVLRARLGNRDEALKDVKTINLLKSPPLVALQMACVYAITSSVEPEDTQDAIKCLQTALRGEPRLILRAGRDSDLLALRKLPQYRQLMSAATQLVVPNSLQNTTKNL